MTTGTRASQWIVQFGYDGSRFAGLQPQPGMATAGAALLARIHGACSELPWAVSFAARTDAGVHATANMVSFRLPTELATHAARAAITARHGDGLVAVSAGVLPQRTMARALALRKHYRYVIHAGSRDSDSPADAWALGSPLDTSAMAEAAMHLVGTHDYSSFQDARCTATNPVKTIETIQLTPPAQSAPGAQHLGRVDIWTPSANVPDACRFARPGAEKPQACQRRVEDFSARKRAKMRAYGALEPMAMDNCQHALVIDIIGNSFLRKMVRIIVGTLVEVGTGLRPASGMSALLAARSRAAAGLTAPASGLTLVDIEVPTVMRHQIDQAFNACWGTPR